MELRPLFIDATAKTPEISFDSESGVLSIKGMSYPEFGKEFYAPVINWIDQYAKGPKPETVVNIQFKYFNTSSAKSILTILQKLNDIRIKGNDVKVNWFYEENDEQMIQDGENYSALLDFPINLKVLK